MSNDDVLVEYLRVLAERESWRIPDRPPSITEDVLRVFDERAWVEFAVWHRWPISKPLEDTIWGEPKRNESIPWFSPSRPPRIAGDLRWVLTKGQREPGLDAEVRVSEKGKAALAEWDLQRVSKTHKPPTRKKKRRKREPRTVPTSKQSEAYAAYLRVRSYEKVGNELGISAQAAGKRIKAAKAILDGKGRSVRTTKMPVDGRNQETADTDRRRA